MEMEREHEKEKSIDDVRYKKGRGILDLFLLMEGLYREILLHPSFTGMNIAMFAKKL